MLYFGSSETFLLECICTHTQHSAFGVFMSGYPWWFSLKVTWILHCALNIFMSVVDIKIMYCLLVDIIVETEIVSLKLIGEIKNENFR